MPYPLPLTRTEAYLAYKAGVIQQSDLKPSLAVPRNGIDAWLAYWTGIAEDYPKREDGTPHILQEEEAYIAYLCGVLDEYPEKCLRRVGAYLRYIISARWGRPDHPLNREELYLSLIKTQFIPSGDPSSDIVIDGTAKAPFVDVKVYGDTYQQSYTGKNLLSAPDNTVTAGSMTCVTSDDNKFTANGTVSESWGFNIVNNRTAIKTIPAGSYVLSLSKALAFPVSFQLRATSSASSLIGVKTINAGSTSETFTLSEDANIFTFWSTASQNTQINDSFTVQIEAGSTATSYEPYVGAQPSPNPDYPQAIQTVTGEQTISINGTDYPIDLGSIELCKLGDYQDYIWEDRDEWKIHKATNKIVVDGTENWAYPDSGANYTFFQFSRRNFRTKYGNAADFYASNTEVGFAKADKFEQIVASAVNMRTEQGIGFTTEGSGWFRISVANTIATTIETFKAWLAENVVTVLYALETPTDIVITDQNLIDQLNALKQGGAEEGTTYIKVSATEPNLPAKLYVEAPKYD